MNEIMLNNKRVKVTIDLNGGDIRSIMVNNEEFLWMNESGLWPDKIRKPNAKNQPSPILFPIVGPLYSLEQMSSEKKLKEITREDKIGYEVNGVFYNKDDTGYFIGDQFYKMGQHGFLRDSHFELISNSNSECRIKLISDDETKKQYPFDFELMIDYKLTAVGIVVCYSIKNIGENQMPFNIGEHPGFKVKDDLTNYYLIFDNNENSVGICKNNHHCEIKDGRLQLNKEMLEGGAVIFNNLHSKRCTLFNSETPVLRYNIEAQNLLLWSADPDGFICIEPWHGEPRTFNNLEESTKNGKVIVLNPNEIFSFRRNLSLYDKEFLERFKRFLLNNEKDNKKVQKQ